MKTIIFDTSALITTITGNANFTQSLLLLAEKKLVKIVASQDTLDELKAVLEYEKVKKIIKTELEYFLQIYWQNVELVDVPHTTKSLARGTTKDPKDDMYIALCEHTQADYLVSLDRKHLVVLEYWKNTQIVLPTKALIGVAKSYGFESKKNEFLPEWWHSISAKLLSQKPNFLS